MITAYEADLTAHLARELDPKHRVASLSMKTSPLSDDCKEEIRILLERRGYRVEFPVEDVPRRNAAGDLGPVPQHFVRVFAVKTG